MRALLEPTVRIEDINFTKEVTSKSGQLAIQKVDQMIKKGMDMGLTHIIVREFDIRPWWKRTLISASSDLAEVLRSIVKRRWNVEPIPGGMQIYLVRMPSARESLLDANEMSKEDEWDNIQEQKDQGPSIVPSAVAN